MKCYDYNIILPSRNNLNMKYMYARAGNSRLPMTKVIDHILEMATKIKLDSKKLGKKWQKNSIDEFDVSWPAKKKLV